MLKSFTVLGFVGFFVSDSDLRNPQSRGNSHWQGFWAEKLFFGIFGSDLNVSIFVYLVIKLFHNQTRNKL